VTEIKSSAIRAVIMDLIKSKFAGFTLWRRIEANIAILCSELPELTDDSKRNKLITKLNEIKKYLLEQGVEETELDFIDEEIDRYEQTKQISLYVETDDEVDPEIIDKYSRLGYGSEGIMGIHLAYNYSQLKRLTNGVYKKTGLLKFYISREKTIYGKIIAEIYEHAQKIPIASLVESKQLQKETGEPLKKYVALFGDKINKSKYNLIKEIEMPFFVYRFITEHNQDLILLSTKQCEIGDYIITGVTTQCDDLKSLTESAKLPTKLPYMFAQTIKNRIIKFQNHDEFRARISHLAVSKKNIWNFPFTIKIKNKNEQFVLKHPTWFKWVMWAWTLHKPKGLFNNYPLHLLIIGPQHSGKSLLLNGAHARSKESRSIFSGSSSTLKHLVPSFKYNPARLGYLAESNRFSYCDEFLRCLVNTKTTKEGSQREEGVAIMNDLLEHQKREAGSGVSRVNVNMTSRIIATTNPIKNVKCVEDLINLLDASFLSRWMIYYQTNNHVRLVRDSKDSDLNTLNYTISNSDWIGIIDYLHTFDATYDLNKVGEIKESVMPILSETLKKHYDARHMHHIECLMDGIIKARCLFERDMSFNAKAKDYEILDEVWKKLIGSWIDSTKIKSLPIDQRIFYLPENCQWLYWQFNELKRPVGRIESEEIALKELTKDEYRTAMIILLDNRIIIEDNGSIRPHWMNENENKQSRIKN